MGLFKKTTTLLEARRIVKRRIEAKKTTKCPVCSRKVGPVKRPLSATMAAQLIVLYRHDKHGVVKFADVLGKSTVGLGGDYAKLVHWGLIERVRPAHFRMTKKGRLFARGRIKIPKYALLYNRNFYGLIGEEVTIIDCMNSGKFDYEKLMKDQA